MALADEVTARYSASRLRQLTNPNDQDASSTNTTLLAKAVTDIQAEFAEITATTYDNSNAKHVAVAVQGVVAKLLTWQEAAGEKADAAYDRFVERCRALAKVTGRDRITPKTKSVLTVSDEKTSTNETVYPDTDRDHYEDLIPDPPA